MSYKVQVTLRHSGTIEVGVSADVDRAELDELRGVISELVAFLADREKAQDATANHPEHETHEAIRAAQYVQDLHELTPVSEPALPPEQKVDEAEPARAGLVDTKPEPLELAATNLPRLGSAIRKDAELAAQAPEPIPAFLPKHEPEPKPMMIMKSTAAKPMDLTGDTRFVTLRARSGAYLALDGSRLIDDKRHAYRGTVQQAQRMRETKDPAWGLQILPYSNQKG